MDLWECVCVCVCGLDTVSPCCCVVWPPPPPGWLSCGCSLRCGPKAVYCLHICCTVGQTHTHTEREREREHPRCLLNRRKEQSQNTVNEHPSLATIMERVGPKQGPVAASKQCHKQTCASASTFGEESKHITSGAPYFLQVRPPSLSFVHLPTLKQVVTSNVDLCALFMVVVHRNLAIPDPYLQLGRLFVL